MTPKGKPDKMLHILSLSNTLRNLGSSGYEFTIRVKFRRGGQVTPTVNYESARATTPLNARTIAAERLLGWLEREVNQNHDQ